MARVTEELMDGSHPSGHGRHGFEAR